MFRDTYKSYNESISPSDKLIADTIDKVNVKKVISFKKPIFAVAAVIMAIMIVVFSLPVLAMRFDPVYEFMYHFYPEFAQLYTPVNQSSTSNDIKMEVLACYVYEDSVEIYFTMQDLTGERFDGGVSLNKYNDSYSIYIPYKYTRDCKQVTYDSETKTAGFLATFSRWDDEDISGNKLTFSVNEIVTEDRYYNFYVPVELSIEVTDKESQKVNINSGGLKDKKKSTKALIPTTSYEDFDVHNVELTGMGYVDGNLHIQCAVKNDYESDNEGKFYLIDKTTFDAVSSKYDFCFIDEDDNIKYCEYVFDVSKEDLENYKILCDWFVQGVKIKGDWKATFQIENKGEYVPLEENIISIPSDVNLSDIEILNMGIEVPHLIYADDNKLIISGTCGIIVYDLNKREVTHRLSCEFLEAYGVEYPNPLATKNGDKVCIYDASDDFNGIPREERDGFLLYDIENGTLIKQQEREEPIFKGCESFYRNENMKEKYADRSKLTGSIYIDKGDYLVFLQGDLDWSMKSLQIVICDYETGDKEIIDVFK